MALGSAYVPGVCNIGPIEIAMRRRAGHLALGLTLGLWVVLGYIGVSSVMRFWLAIPATITAVCYLQAYMHFCANFGLRGVFNFSPALNRTDTVSQAAYRQKDRLKALQILGISILIGVSVGLLAFWL